MTPAAMLAQIEAWARELGFQQIGVSALDTGEHLARFDAWLAAGMGADMDWLAEHRDKRADPALMWPGSLRVISARMDYLPEKEPDLIAKLDAREKALISRYALGRDYHRIVRKSLASLAKKIEGLCDSSHRAFVDSAPLLERAYAEQAGLGWFGKNTMIINSRAGSYFFLGELLTSLPLPISQPDTTPHCGSCNACIERCPTQAIIAPYHVDSSRCISYITIETIDPIPLALRPLIGTRIFGCDDCQAVCPWNKFAQTTARPADLGARDGFSEGNLIEWFFWSEETFLKKTEGMALRRAGFEIWLRNLAVALGNTPTTPEIIAALKQRRESVSALVAEHIDWALARHTQAQS